MGNKSSIQVEPLRKQTLSGIVAKKLEEMILGGEILPGQRINESHLSRRFGVSRAPVREAIRHLEKSGIVEIRVNRGTFVRTVQIREVEELYDVRAVLDALACEKAAENATRQDVARLKRILNEMTRFVEEGKAREYFRSNLAFHETIIRCSGSHTLSALYEGIRKKAALFRRTSLSIPGRMRASVLQHSEILAAIENRDGERAARLAKAHTLEAKRDLLETVALKSDPDAG